MTDERLRANLLEDMASSNEAERLLPTVLRLKGWPAPAPTAPETASLIQSLQSAMAEQRASPWRKLRIHAGEWWPWLLLRAQARVVRHEIWIASTLVMVLGALVTLIIYEPTSSSEALPLVLLAPVVAAVGVSFLYGSAVDPALEIALATPTSPRLVLLTRLTLVFGFDLGLGLAGSLALALFQPGVSLWPLVTAWLAPMAFLSALSLLLSVLSADPGAGALISLGLWVVQNVVRMTHANNVLWLLTDLTSAAARPWLWSLAIVMGGLALWAGAREEHWLGGRV